MLELRQVHVQYPGSDSPILDDVSLTAGPGVTAIIGPSGSGKTTLFRAISGELTTSSGAFLLDGNDLKNGSIRIGVVHQDYRLIDFLNVSENIELARELAGLAHVPGFIDDLLDQVGLSGYGQRRTTTLSGGQQQRVAIARALAVEPGLVLADEPTGALDRQNTDAVASLLHQLGEQAGIPILLATHDPRIAAIASRVLELIGDGQIHVRAGA